MTFRLWYTALSNGDGSYRAKFFATEKEANKCAMEDEDGASTDNVSFLDLMSDEDIFFNEDNCWMGVLKNE